MGIIKISHDIIITILQDSIINFLQDIILKHFTIVPMKVLGAQFSLQVFRIYHEKFQEQLYQTFPNPVTFFSSVAK